jgi:plastocyanin
MRALRERSAAALALLALTVSGCGGEARAEAAAVSVTDAGFEVATLVVPSGTEVRWSNHGSRGHTVTGGAAGEGSDTEIARPNWDSGPLRPGETFSRRFTEEGLYYYWCSYHQDEQMVGTVRVEAP